MKVGFIGAGKVGCSLYDYFVHNNILVTGCYTRTQANVSGTEKQTQKIFTTSIDKILTKYVVSKINKNLNKEEIKDIMESVNIELAQVSDIEPETYINESHIKDALEYAGISQPKAQEIGQEYISTIKSEELPLIGDIIPNKAAKAVKDNNEKILLKEEIKELNRKIAESQSDGEDIIIKVNDDKKALIRRETIDGESCLVIPISENENIKIN